MIQLMRYKMYPETMEVLYDRPFSEEMLKEDFELKDGRWYVDEEGWLVGENRRSSAAMLMSKGEYFGDVLIEFDAATVLPATRDINLTFHGSWDEEKNCRDVAYVFGLEGWYNGYVGFEKSPEYKFVVNTKLLDFKPGKVYHVAVGNIGNDLFVVVDGVLALEIRDPDPIDINKYGRIGFEAYCTRVKYKNLQVKRLAYEDGFTPYEPEF
ncbi:MAG: hypothetical protein IKU17_04100 [Clostridia bacterium]|nr:hypothetical protein [Clostridia bacterium]